MSETPEKPTLPLPRVELEPTPAARLDLTVEPPIVPVDPLGSPGLVNPGPGSLLPLLGGPTIVVTGLGALWAAGFVTDQFARGPVQGGLAAAAALAGFGVLGLGVWRELRGLFALRHVDALRSDLASDNPKLVRRAARSWLADLPGHADILPALDVLEDPAAIRALLRAGPAAALRDQADARARVAALQIGAIIAATPSPALDALAVGWRGIRLVREVAVIHGMRPGLLGTLALLRRTALAAVSVAATELAINAATHALLSNPLLERVLGDMAGAGVAARRMVVLARAASIACGPLLP